VVSAGEVLLGEGAYRRTHVLRWKRGQAPRVVRIAALSSFYLGEMVVPGALAAAAGALYILLIGLCEAMPERMVWVLVLAAPTGLLVAHLVFKAGRDLLKRSPEAPDSAVLAATWAIFHNVALLAGLHWAAEATGETAVIGVPVLPFVVYACVSLVHAVLILTAVSATTEYTAMQERDQALAG